MLKNNEQNGKNAVCVDEGKKDLKSERASRRSKISL